MHPEGPEPASRCAALIRIREDRSRGAAELAAEAIAAMAAAAALGDAPAERAVPELRALVRCIAQLRPTMAPIANWSIAALERLTAAADLSQAAGRIGPMLARERRRVRGGVRRAAEPHLVHARRIVTLSWSSTVFDLLARHAGSALVTVAESRPLLEGRTTAERLLDRGRSVRVVTDAQLAGEVSGADLVLVGADAITRDLAAVNKTGSLLAALAAAAAGVPFLVAADTFKIDPHRSAADVDPEPADPAEVWPEHPQLCANPTFEAIPAALVGLYLTERGAVPPPALADEVARWQARYEAAGL